MYLVYNVISGCVALPVLPSVASAAGLNALLQKRLEHFPAFSQLGWLQSP